MEAFTYLKSVNNIETLNKLVSNIESYTPTLLKYIALRTVNLVNKRGKINKNNLKEVEKIVKVVEEQVNKEKSKEWVPSEVVSVMSLFSTTQLQIKGETRNFIESKLVKLNNYNMYDIVQLLNTAKKIRVRVDECELKEYIEKNIEILLKQASIANIYSILSVLSINGVKLSEKTIWKIMEHIEEQDEELEFKELTNMYNSICRQIKMSKEGKELEEDGKKDKNMMKTIQGMMETMYNRILQHIEKGNDDFEGIVDVLEGIINVSSGCNINKINKIRYGRSRNSSTTEAVEYNEVIDNDYKNDEMMKRCTVLIERIKYHFNSNLEPKLIRILIRNISIIRYYDEELMKGIITHYKNNSRKWSLQGNIDLLNFINMFKMRNKGVLYREFQIEEWMECVNKYKQIMNENHINQIFINMMMYNNIKGEEIIDSIIKTGLVGERELYIGLMIRRLNNEHILEKLSLESLNILNKIKIGIKPQNRIRCDDLKDVGKLKDKVKYINSKTNLNFVNFCNFNIVYK